MPRRTARLALVAAGAVAGLLALAAPASAHVTVDSSDARQGGYGVVAVRVPTESDTASTTKIVLQLPTDTPFAFVGVQPTPGWTDTERVGRLPTPITTDDGTVDSATTQVTWTARAGSAVAPGHFQQFFVQVGPFPKTDSVTFKALQYYSDGSVVRWIETPAPGSAAEPEHPAPTLQLAAAASTSGGSSAASSGPSGTTASAGSSSSGGGSDTGALVLAIVALVVSVGAVAFGVVSRARAKGPDA